MSRSSKIELLYFCVLIESLAGYAYDEKHNGRHTDGKHDDLYPHGTKHAKHDKDATFAYQIVETDRTFTYDAAGKLVSATETEDNYGTYIYTYEYDLMGNRTYMEKTLNGTVAEWHKYEYNESNQLVSEQLYNGKKTTSLAYTYDADGNRITETGKVGTDKVEKTYEYTVENRLAAVHDGDELLLAAAYDGDGNRVFLLNYNLHTDDDWKGNSGNGNGNNKDNSGSGNNGKGNSGNNGNGNGNGKGKGNNKKNSKSWGTDDAGYGNATNAEENNSQNQCGILFPVQEEVSATEADLIARIKTTGKEKNYELIEYLNDVNREHAEVLVEQNINGRTDTSYIYGAEINGGFDRISLDRFDGSTGYYLYDARGSVSGITNEEGQVYQSYRYSVTGEITFGAPQYENEYTYNGESYNPNIQSQYLRARYYCVVTATFLTEDSYLGNQTEPLTLNRYNYCVSSYLNYTDPSGNEVEVLESLKGWIIDPDTQAQKTIENYENQRLSLEDAIESGLLNNRAGQIFLDYGDIVMGPAVKTPADIIVIRETVKGNSDSKEMQRTATAGFYAGFVGQGIEYTQIISNADYQLSMIITSAKGVNSINNPLSYLLFIKDFSLTQTLDAAKAGLQDAWNGTYDSAIGRKIGAGTFNYLLMTIGGAQLKGKGNACEAVESGRDIVPDKGFSSFKDLKTHLDSPGDGKVWHHIVEQSQITGSGFSSEQVNNINNVIAIPHGKGSIHAKISGYYSSKQFFTGGKTVRQWLAGQDFKTQFDFGMNLLKEYGDVIPSSKGWIFRTFE